MAKKNKKAASSIKAGDTIYLERQRMKVTVTEVAPGMWKNDLIIKWNGGTTTIAGREEVTYY